MGRPEPYVLFAQTFAHPHLDEYVDEVLFAEPVVITACEFIEQNASSTSQAVALAGATLPPSFAVEVFVQCEGETRFRRLCQPFLYSHSSSNVLEVEAIISNHLVVRGSYRSLSLVIYGNTAEDLGQFNIGLDDSSLNNLVTSAEGKLEDLPLALHSTSLMIDQPLTSLMKLSQPGVLLDIPAEVKQFLQLMGSMLEQLNLGDAFHKILDILISAAFSYVSYIKERSRDSEGLCGIFNNAKKDLLKLCKAMQDSKDGSAHMSVDFSFLESENDLVSSKHLVDILSKHWNFNLSFSTVGCPWQSKNSRVIFGLGVALFLCSARESCFHFVNGGGMEQIVHLLSSNQQESTAATLLLLAVIEQATQHSFGCEGFLGWWPREDENVPSGASEGYSQLLNLLLRKPRHDIASHATHILQRLSFYEVASLYECAVLSALGGLSSTGRVSNVHLDVLISMKSQLKKILNLINLCGPIQDPSPPSYATKSLFLGQTDGLLSCKATSCLISSSKCCFSQWDADPHLLALLKERGFFSLSAAILSSSIMRSEESKTMDLILEILSSFEAIILSLLFCRSGLIFLLHHYELSSTILHALRGDGDANLEECMPIRYASALIANNFFCKPSNVAMIVRIHLRVVTAIDRLLMTTPNSEEFLWVLWELSSISRSDCGRQALLALTYFPEALVILFESLRLVKEPEESGSRNSGALPLTIAISHSAAEIIEVIVTDSTASSLGSWIVHAMELYKALHSSPTGSNRKDAPTRLLEWIDASVVYQKSGAVGLLRYAAVLASGGDANSNLANSLVSELTDLDNAGESAGYDVNVMDNLGKTISEKTFDGITLRDSSIAQLTTAFQSLAYISENSTVAAALYDEGAVAVIYAVLVDSRHMLEKYSNNYDYLVDEGNECNSTSDLLLERNREQSLVNLLVPCLVLLLNLLQTLQVAKEEHRNSKLMNALVRLHREVSPKLAACAFDLSTSFPNSALGFGAVCHLLVSVLACWPVYGWSPGLFSSLLDSVQATSLQALGPKETCSLLCLLNDLFPDEGIWLWKNGMPLLSAVKKLGIRTILGSRMEDEVNWYLEPCHQEKLLGQLALQLEKILQVVQHYAISTLAVIQDMLRIFIIRLCCHKADNASFLLRPIFLWTRARVSDLSSLSDLDAYKICRYLDFFASLLEHPRAKALLLNDGVIQLLDEVSQRCLDDLDTDDKLVPGFRFSTKCSFSLLNWCLPVFKSFSLLCCSRPSLKHIGKHTLHYFGLLSAEDYSLILRNILLFCQVLPVGKELVACLSAFRNFGSCNEGRTALASIFIDIYNADERESEGYKKGSDASFNASSWKMNPPLLCCWKKLLISIDSNDYIPMYAIQAVDALSSGSLSFCLDGSSMVLDRIVEVKFLFGLSDAVDGVNVSSPKDVIGYVQEMIDVFKLKSGLGDYPEDSNTTLMHQVLETAESLLLLLEKPTGSVNVEDITLHEDASLIPSSIVDSLKLCQFADDSIGNVDDNLLLGLGDKFMWECPEILPDRLNALPAKRKMSTMDGQARRARGENSPAEISSQNTFSRGSGISTAPSLPSRRDTFRQRKPNTSRPPSMHVDDYVARERNVDGAINSNVISIQRVGSSSGRPPSIHVDEFMARQRERQNPVAAVVVEALSQVKGGVPANDTDLEKLNKPTPMKTDLDDDLQGIDIVFDGEDSDPDDKLPFPHLDNTVQQSDPMLVEQGSPRSIVEETESNGNDTSQFSPMRAPPASIVDENAQSEFSSRMSVSRPEFPLARESSVSSGKKYFEHLDDGKNTIPVRSTGGVDTSHKNQTAPPSKFLAEPRANAPNYFHKNSPQHHGSGPLSIGSQGFYEQRFFPGHPPLPPVPPPPTAAPAISQPSDLAPTQSSPYANFVSDTQQRYSSTFHVPTDYPSGYTSSFSSASVRPPPPLPPTPPPLSSTSPLNLSSSKTSFPSTPGYNLESVGMNEIPQNPNGSSTDTRLGGVSASGVMLASNPLPSIPHMVFSRPSMPVNHFGGITTQQQNENSLSILPNPAIPQSSLPSIHSMPQLLPLQPPQLPRPPHPPPQHLRPPIVASQQPEQVVSMQMHQLQMLQQPRVSPQYYQSQPVGLSHAPPQQQFEHPPHQPMHHQQPGDAATTSQQQQDSAMSLHEFFKSPEAIQSLLSDREKLCQLLEQHPKLMQMLQERLGQR